MAEDSVSAHGAQQQKKWEEYLAAHGVAISVSSFTR